MYCRRFVPFPFYISYAKLQKKMMRVRNNLFYLFFINNTRRYRLNENTDNTNNFPQIAQIYTDLFLEHK